MTNITKDILFIGSGVYTTIKLLLGSISIGIILGLIVSIMKYNNILSKSINITISIIRGTPLILQLSIFYFTMPNLLGVKLTITTSGIIAFGINSAAYIAEIFRSGINSIPKGQFEAATTLNIPKYYMWKDIILPQVIKNIAPNLTNESIALLKETALIGTIGGMDIMRTAQTIGAEHFTYFVPLFIAGTYYYILVILITIIGKKIEKNLSNTNKNK